METCLRFFQWFESRKIADEVSNFSKFSYVVHWFSKKIQYSNCIFWFPEPRRFCPLSRVSVLSSDFGRQWESNSKFEEQSNPIPAKMVDNPFPSQTSGANSPTGPLYKPNTDVCLFVGFLDRLRESPRPRRVSNFPAKTFPYTLRTYIEILIFKPAYTGTLVNFTLRLLKVHLSLDHRVNNVAELMCIFATFNTAINFIMREFMAGNAHATCEFVDSEPRVLKRYSPGREVKQS